MRDVSLTEPDAEQPIRPEGCRENENLARLLPVLTGGKNHPSGRGEHASAYEHCNEGSSCLVVMIFSRKNVLILVEAVSDETWIYSLEHEIGSTDDRAQPSARGNTEWSSIRVETESSYSVDDIGMRMHHSQQTTLCTTMFGLSW